MLKFLLIDTDNLVKLVIVPGTEGLYVHDSVYGGYTAKQVDTVEEDSIIIASWHWDGSAFAVHTPQSTSYSTWNTSTYTWDNWLDFTTSNSWNTSTIVANGVSTASFGSAIPSGTLLQISIPPGVTPIADTTITSGQVVFSAEQAGDYIFTFTKTGYVPYTHTITAS